MKKVAVLTSASPIKEAIRLSRRATAEEIRDVSSESQNVAEVLVQLDQLKDNLLPIEKGLLPEIESKKSAATRMAKQLEALDKWQKYPEFSLEPLTWRDKEGFPRLAVFSLMSPNVEFAVVGSYNGGGRKFWTEKMTPELPPEMKKCFKDVLGKLSVMARETKKTIRLRAQFAVLIPQPIREEILKVQGDFKEIFVVAEIPKWDLKETAVPRPNKDPLVVGYDGFNHWLIAAFDPTPLEDLIKMEFCVKRGRRVET